MFSDDCGRGNLKRFKARQSLVSILPASLTKEILNLLNRNIGHLQFLLNKKLSLKPLPRLNFTVDRTEEKAAEIEQLINKIAQD